VTVASERPSRANTWAVIVTYHPDSELSQRVAVAAAQVSGLVVVDNGSSDATRSAVDAAADVTRAMVIRNDTNLGIATALNQGCSEAMARGAAWILMLDQDSTALPTLVERLAEVYDAVPHRDRLGMIGSGVAETGTYEYCRHRLWSEQPVVITSGSLLSVAAYGDCGRFEDDLFIDYVDAEYCLRLRRRRYAVVLSCRETMRHAIGAPSVHRLAVRSVTPTNHSPLRRYYITRNRMTIWRRYWRTESRFVAWDIVEFAKELTKLVLFETQRAEKLESIAAGVRDAMRRRLGARRR